MSQITRQEVLSQMRRRYLRAGRPSKSQRVTELVELFGSHRKAALCALRLKPVVARALRSRSVRGILAGKTAEATQGQLAEGGFFRSQLLRGRLVRPLLSLLSLHSPPLG